MTMGTWMAAGNAPAAGGGAALEAVDAGTGVGNALDAAMGTLQARPRQGRLTRCLR
jgi:hypothetical protein